MAEPRSIESVIQKVGQQLDGIYLGTKFKHFHITSTKIRLPLRLLIPTSNYAFGSWRRDEDIHVVCMSEGRTETFWHIVGEAVLEQEARLSVPRNSQLDLTEHLRLQALLGTGRLILHHCRVPESFDLQLMREYGVPLYTESLPRAERLRLERELRGDKLKATVRKCGEDLQHHSPEGEALGMVHDATQLLGRFGRQDLEIWPTHHTTFCNALRCLRKWAVKSGILHRLFAYMNADTLLWLVYQDHAHYYTPDPEMDKMESLDRTRHYLRGFFSRCSRFAFEIEDDAMRLKLRTPSGRMPGKYMSNLGVEALCNGIQRLAEALETTGSTVDVGVLVISDGLGTFVENGDIFVKLDVECLVPQKRNQIRNNAIPTLVQHLAVAMKQWTSMRLWPYTVEEDLAQGSSTYVLAVKWRPGSINTPSELSEKIAAWLEAADYNRSDVVLQVQLARAADIMELMVPKPKGNTSANAAFNESTTSTARDQSPSTSDVDMSEHPRECSRRGQTPAFPGADSIETEGLASPSILKFRTASQVISRLRWDPAHAGTAYEVGYEDRFAGLKWMKLEDWGKKATEDEDFIPEHRIRMFRRREDEVVVWDREARMDGT